MALPVTLDLAQLVASVTRITAIVALFIEDSIFVLSCFQIRNVSRKSAGAGV